MSDTEGKKPGFFGRLFGRKEEPKPEPDYAKYDAKTGELPASVDTSAAEPVASPADALQGSEKPVLEAAELVEAPAPVEIPVPAPEPVAAAAPGMLAPAEPAPKKSWLSRLSAGLAKTSSKLSDGITSIFTKRKLDADTLEDLEDLLIQADLGLDTTQRITSAISKGRFEKGIEADDVRRILAQEVSQVLTGVAKPIVIDPAHKPHVILVVGVNGSGKTTTIGKMGAQFRREGRSVLMAAGDTFRAAAIDQLKVWGERTHIPVIAREVGADSSGLAFDALRQATDECADVLLLDTAGRLQNKAGLMDELEKVIRVMRKIDATAPHDVILVLDATTGQNALSQVEVFSKRAGVTGLVMTKLDGTARGGILVAIAAKYALPVYAIGVGEGIDDLAAFDPQDFSRTIAQL